MAEYTLHCFAQSGNAYKAALMLALAGADWEPVFVDFFNGETRTPEYRELNAMGAGAFAPFDVVGGGGPVKNPGGFWYNGAYVFTDDNNLGFRAAIDRDLPDILADFVFQKVIVARKVIA